MAENKVVNHRPCLDCPATQKRKASIRKNADALTMLFFELSPGYENYVLRVGCDYRGTPFCCKARRKIE